MIQQQQNNFNLSKFSYFQSFMVVMGIIVFGFTLQFFVGELNISLLHFPVNVILLLLIVIAICIGYLRFRKGLITIWLSSTKAAISSIVGFSFVSLLMGFIVQEKSASFIIQRIGLNNIAYSWAYTFSFLILILSLGFATIKRLYPFRKENMWFTFNHLGLWITLVAANFGFADQTHLRLRLSDADYSNIAYNENSEITILPFEVRQASFSLENYNPCLTIIDSSEKNASKKNSRRTFAINDNTRVFIKDYSIIVIKSYNSARKINEEILPFDSIGAAPAAFVKVENLKTKEVKEGWISSGNLLIEKSSLILDQATTLIMLPPSQKEMTLLVKIRKNEETVAKTIAINSPQRFEGYKIYLFSYNEQKGKWSNSCVVELIKDRWQPVVYLGLAMMIIGSFFVFWRGKK